MILWLTGLESVIDLFMKCLHNSIIYNLPTFWCGHRGVLTCVHYALWVDLQVQTSDFGLRQLHIR